MKYRRLGTTGLRVSPICLGTMTFGEADENSFMHQVGTPEKESWEILAKALDSGVNFIDTADIYGQDGLSERVIGRFFQQHGRRDEVVVATKFRFTMGKGPNASGASRHRIIECCEASLRRLNTDYIDLYQIHMQDVDTPEEETLRALDDLVRDGKVRYIGCSNYAAYRLSDSLWLSKTEHLERFAVLQAQYSLVERSLEREHIPLCLKHGVGLLPWSPLAGGFLSGKYKRDEVPADGARFAKWKDRFGRFGDQAWNVVDALTEVASELDAPVAAVALAWLLKRPTVSSVIFGARTMAQLDANLRAAELELSPTHVSKLEEVSRPDWGYPYDFMSGVMGRW